MHNDTFKSLYMQRHYIYIYTYTFERGNFRYTGADIGMLSRYDLKCIRVKGPYQMTEDHHDIVDSEGDHSTVVALRAKPCLNTSISVTDASNKCHVFVSILVVECSCVGYVQGMQMAYQQGEMAYGVAILSQCAGSWQQNEPRLWKNSCQFWIFMGFASATGKYK